MQSRPLYPHSVVLLLYGLKYRYEPLKLHPRGQVLRLIPGGDCTEVHLLRPSERATASHASAVSM